MNSDGIQVISRLLTVMPGSSVWPPSAAFSSLYSFFCFPRADLPGDIIYKARVEYESSQLKK